MLKFLLNKNILKCNKVQGLHCNFCSEGDLIFYYVLISRKKGAVEIEKFFAIQGSFIDLSLVLMHNVPIMLSIDGKGVLSKKIKYNDSKSIIQHIIPNADENDFIFDESNGVDNYKFVSLTRKDSVEELLNSFSINNFYVLDLTIGQFKIANLLKIFNHLPSKVKVDQYNICVDIESYQLIDFDKYDSGNEFENYIFDDKILTNSFILPFYNALSYYVPDNEKIKYSVVEEHSQEFASKQLFKVASWIALLFILCVLICNLFIYNNFALKKQYLESAVLRDKKLLNNLKKLNEDFIWKENFFNQSGILKNTKMYFFADQIGNSLPDDIYLTKMEIYPLINKIKKLKEIEVQPDKISIFGQSIGSQFVDLWVNDLRKLNWVEDVYIGTYTKEENSSTGLFSLEINIRKDKR